MMLNDFHATNQQVKLEVQRDDETNTSTARMNSSVNSISEIESTITQADLTSSHVIGSTLNNSSTSSSSSSEHVVVDHVQATDNLHHSSHQGQHIETHRLHPQHHPHHHPQHLQQLQEPYFTSGGTPSTCPNLNKSNKFPVIVCPLTSSSNRSLVLDNKTLVQSSLLTPNQPVNMNVEATQHSNMVPSAHCSDLHNNMHYSLPAKNLPNSSPSNMALNFSHDLLLQTGHNSQVSLHHQQDTADNADSNNKSQLSNSFEFDSGSLIQSAAAVGMWKNTMGLSPFKHPAITAEHSFLQTSDMNSFSSWPHGSNISQQTTQSMTHQILEGQHLIGYPQHHQRSLPIPNQDLVGASLKNQACADQATSFMLNSINHQASASHSVPISSHHTTHQPHDNLNLRSQPLDQCATSYSLTMNDNQFYNSSRTENRSHVSPVKQSVLLSDRSVQLTLNNHHASQLPYHSADHANPQPTTSHHVPGSSSGHSSSKNSGTFRCPHCNETFSVRNLYQSHLKTHSQEKGNV